MRKVFFLVSILVIAFGAAFGSFCQETEAQSDNLKTGWVIGDDETGTAVILHTKNGGKTWRVQGDNSKWYGYLSCDISAVDGQTAWAAT